MTARIVVLGAGPVGLAVAAGLARHGAKPIVIEPRDGPILDSRATCISRRSLEVLDAFGIGGGVQARALPWTAGRSFWRDREVLRFAMPHDADQRHPPMVNIGQQDTERCLLGDLPDADIRWGTAMTGLAVRDDGVALTLTTPNGETRLDADWLVACDGARSPTRAALGLSLQGETYTGRYLIADIRFRGGDAGRVTERRAWFDPVAVPGGTLLMHRQPDGVWRIDWQLGAEEDGEAAQEPAAVRAKIDTHLASIGELEPYDVVMISLYRAHCRTLDGYVHGRVVFAGDAAHLLPIFGVRGLNSGIEDAGNLAWKLAAVARGEADAALLDSYSIERVAAARENIRQARKTTLFMTPPSPGHTLFRDAALSLAASADWAKPLIDPRQSAAAAYAASPLSTPEAGDWPAGPPPGAALPSVKLRDGTFLAERLGTRPAVVVRGDAALTLPDGVDLVRLGDEPRAAALLGLDTDGAGYLVRPDHVVAWRWRQPDSATLRHAAARLRGRAA